MSDHSGSIPHRILVVGSSGNIGRRVLNILCNERSLAHGRICLLERYDSGTYHVVECGHLELQQPHAVSPWLERKPDAIVYLAGVPAQCSGNDQELARQVNVVALKETVQAIEHVREARVIYASSTAVHTLADSAYAVQKNEAERTLLSSPVPGIALRLPTVLPRSLATARTLLLNQPIERALLGQASVWPIAANRKIRVMSLAAAARNIVAALAARSGPRAIALDLPATVITPRSLCEAAGAPEPLINLDQKLDDLLAGRAVEIHTERALYFGFPKAESIAKLISALRALNS